MAETPRDDRDEGRDEPSARILVVDDEEIVHVSLKRILGRYGHRVDAVFGAAEAMALIGSRGYDLVISDLMMPETDGIQLLETMRAEGHAVPVLMLTGYPTIRTALQALRLGAVDYLSKPFTRQELMGPVHRTLRRTAVGSADSSAGAPANEAGGPGAPELGLLPGDRFFLREHSWAVYQKSGTMRVGIEASFLETVGTIDSVEAPGEADVVEQGFVGFRLTTGSGELHNVFMPVSGQVVEVNEEALADPASLESAAWLVLVRPTRLEKELALLLKS